MPLPPGPGQGHDPVLGEIAAQALDLGVAPDEVGHVGRQVGRRIEGPQRPVVVGGAGDDQPVEPQRLVEVLDRAQPGVDEPGAARRVQPGWRPPMASTTACDSTIWPPLPAAAIRAA